MVIFNTLFLIFSVIPWPIKEFDKMHSVSSVMGDARDEVSSPRFHRGVDIAATVGTEVFPIRSGWATFHGGGVDRTVKVFELRVSYYWCQRYTHVNENEEIDEGEWVSGIIEFRDNPEIIDMIAEVLDYPDPGGDHLHFDRYIPMASDLTKGVWHNPWLFIVSGFEFRVKKQQK